MYEEHIRAAARSMAENMQRLSLIHIYLHLEGDTVLAHHGGVEALVHIGLGRADIVLEAAQNGLIQVVDDAQHIVAAVSYTHLDVYKRQLPLRVGRGPASEGPVHRAGGEEGQPEGAGGGDVYKRQQYTRAGNICQADLSAG